MSHKVHPSLYRIKEMSDWNTRGFYRNPKESLEEDFKIRQFLFKKLGDIGIEKIEIERFSNKTNIIINSARPGLIIGRGGEGVEVLKKELFQKVFNKSALKQPVQAKKSGNEKPKEIKIEIREVRNPWISAGLSSQWVAQQIEKRVPFRKVLKQLLAKVSANKEVQGVKVEISGRLNGSEIARREWLKLGRLPLQTIRADMDFAKTEAHCTYGAIGIKVWIYKGDKFD